MLRRNKHPYSVDEKSSSGEVVIRYVKYRFLHSWGFLAIVTLWFVFNVTVMGFIWGESRDVMLGAVIVSLMLFVFLMAAWGGIVNRMNIRLEKKIVYPIVDRLLTNSTKISSKKYRVKRRMLVGIDDGDITKGEPYEAVVVFFADGSICEYPFSFVTFERNEVVVVRSLSLTHYICNNYRLIAKARGWFPEITLNTWINIVSFIILGLGGIVFYLLTSVSTKTSVLILVVLIAVFIIAGFQTKLKENGSKGSRLQKNLFNVMSIPIGIVGALLTLGMPFLSVAIVTFFSVLAAVVPPIIIVSIANMINGVSLDDTTKYFVVLVCSSFIIVYCPSYIKGIINRMPFVTYTEGKQHKKRLADFIRYVYDAGVVEFLLNVTYVSFVCIICIMRYQNLGYLFSKEIDDVILNAFVVFLSFECVRSSYKRIGLSAKSFFVKILKVLET